jgi:NAD(P)-dependent dehydrogenase (short-subunit alcohol dehydrogenase family)
MDIDQFSGRGAVVTGGGSGIGRSIALSLASVGLNVVVADIDEDAASRVSSEVRGRGVDSLAVRTDVSQFNQVAALAEAAYAEFGDIAVLANNAGVTWRPYRATWDASIEDFQWIMGINFGGVLNGHRAFVPRMRGTGAPKHIINTSSVVSLVPSPGHAAYAAAKSAVDAFSIAARAEYEIAGIPIDVSILYPGYVKTSIATSERLRPRTQQSTERAVVPWDTYGEQGGLQGAETKEAVSDLSLLTSWHQAIDPALVGPMVVDRATAAPARGAHWPRRRPRRRRRAG